MARLSIIALWPPSVFPVFHIFKCVRKVPIACRACVKHVTWTREASRRVCASWARMLNDIERCK